ncbi:hypothetical protein [Bythopirellula goksoeyrii]|uniref:PEP-CTERM protein-sorting domain-containing protein n=1 Tax=Bythopirellula goksoeyrii TaxID=1400387 RepID=A0A5B9Q3Q5_9BACT|nr:hypothetical protein [Bythopirellula goksoeyrii]QEG33634.1 hypothetical protein Pr1d_08980 [Bythopirellula goksoeyrii]
MRNGSSYCALFLVTLLVLCTGKLSSICCADSIVLESAEMGSAGQVGGTAIQASEYVGWRLTTSAPLTVEQVGGHMYAIPDQTGEVFAALVRLASLSSMPEGSPFTESELIAKATFRPNFPSDDFLTPLSATLIPGSYALVFGTGLFDATGGAGLINGVDQAYIPPTSKSSYISWRVPSSGSSADWHPIQAENMRFVIVGQEASFTADFENDGDVDSNDLTIWQGAYGTNSSGDANGDGDSDGRDFLAWQRQFTGSGGTAFSQTTIVPEPGSFVLLLGLAMAIAVRCCNNW